MYDMIARLAELMAELAEEIACPASDQGVHQTQLSRIQDDLQGIVESARAGQADSVRELAEFREKTAAWHAKGKKDDEERDARWKKQDEWHAKRQAEIDARWKTP